MSDTTRVKTKIIDGYSVGDILVYMISKKLSNETRFRISMKTLRALAGLPSMRIQGTKKFLEELQDTMLEYGWSIVELNGEHFGVVRVDKTDGWKRIGIDQFADVPKSDGRYDLVAIQAALPKRPVLEYDDE